MATTHATTNLVGEGVGLRESAGLPVIWSARSTVSTMQSARKSTTV